MEENKELNTDSMSLWDARDKDEMLRKIKTMSNYGSEVATKHLDGKNWERRLLYEGGAWGSNDFFDKGEWNLSFHATGKCGVYGGYEGICGDHSYIYIDGVIEEPEFCASDAIMAIEGGKGTTLIWLYIYYGENYYEFMDAVNETSRRIQEQNGK